MIRTLDSNDPLLQERSFRETEVQYNLIFRILESDAAIRYKSTDGNMIFAQTPNHNGWLWINPILSSEQKRECIRSLMERLEETSLPGISGDPDIAPLFADEYARMHSLKHHINMTMESFTCPEVLLPAHVRGESRQANEQNTEVVAHYIADFDNRDGKTKVKPVDLAAVRQAAASIIEAGNLKLWIVDDEVVSMANISSRTDRYGRINAVYTDRASRSRGYAGAVVANQCQVLLEDGLTPMLYADISNPAAMKLYRNIGFIPCGKIADIRFTSLDSSTFLRST